MAESPKALVNEWIVKIALGIIMAAGGFVFHQLMYGQSGRADGTRTGWTPEQERDFLEMPHEHRNLMIMDDSILQKVERIEERERHLK